MTENRLKYLSARSVETLRDTVEDNISRYRGGDFCDLMAKGEWSLELDAQVDLAPLAELDPAGTPESEIANSKLVWRALKHLKPSLAYEEGLWVRLTHVECLDYSRARWLKGVSDDTEMVKRVDDHFFANTLAKRRDDNPVSRLWWNAFIAEMAMPDTDLAALGIILKKADIRLNFVERSRTVYRQPLAAGIIRLMQRNEWLADREENFRAFMRRINYLGGGMLFEAMTSEDIDGFMDDCALRAGAPAENQRVAAE